MNESRWARWFWSDKKALGRWHAIAEEGVTINAEHVVRLACGRVRKPPTETAPRPDDAQCPKCLTYDNLRLAYGVPATVETPTLVTAGAN